MNKNYSETFLARWLNNELSEEEKQQFEASEQFFLYDKIAKKSSEFLAPEFKKEEVFNKIQNSLTKEKKSKVKPLFNPWVYSVAASIVVFFGIFYFLNLSEKHVTGIGEQLVVKLPDNTEIILNSNSKVSYHKKNWENNRVVKLTGEAFFKVEKGSTFIVKTLEGNVTVLGTQFNVKTNQNFFEVVCFEGKVKAETKSHKNILTKGNAFRRINDSLPEKWNITETEPSWKNGESTFKSIPIKYVISALKNQYNISINSSKIDENIKFTGSFTHKNLKIALQTVFVPMKIDVTFIDEKSILLDKQ